MDSRPHWTEIWAAFAVTMAKRSRCSRAQIGAVIVSADNRIVATGYNGPPSRWNKLRWKLTSEAPDDWATNCKHWCPRAQAALQGSLDAEYWDCPSNHAEINALMHSSRSDREGGAIYVTGSVCMACAKAIANSGITAVYLVNTDDVADEHRRPSEVRQFLEDCGVFTTSTTVPV